MMVPSTMVWVGIGSIPKFTSENRSRLVSLSWTTLMELLPLSRPMHGFALLAPPILRRSFRPPPALLVLSEDCHSIARLEPQRLEDLSLRIHPAAHSALDPIDRERRNAGSPRQLRLRHHLVQAKLLEVVLARLALAGLLLLPRLLRIGFAARGLRSVLAGTLLALCVLALFHLGDVLVLVHFHMNRAAVRNGSLWSRAPPTVNKICSKIKLN